jgi:glutamyl-tRNA reductase
MENNNNLKPQYFYSVGLSYKKADAVVRGKFSLDANAKNDLLLQAKQERATELKSTVSPNTLFN